MTSSSRVQDQARRAAEARLQGQLDDLEAEYQAAIEAKQDLKVWLSHTVLRIVRTAHEGIGLAHQILKPGAAL